MGLFYDLSQQYKTLSIVGMHKNAGKTTALNYFIDPLPWLQAEGR